jgi:sulfur-carrier protein
MAVILKFIGALRHASGKDKLTIKFAGETSVLELIKKLTCKTLDLRKNLLDEQLDTPKPNALILVNGKEISVLNGLETMVRDGDEVIFIPIVHGG